MDSQALCLEVKYPECEETDQQSVFFLYIFVRNYICLFDYLFISSQMSAKPYFMGSTGILHLR